MARYGRAHHNECMCDGCLDTWRAHNDGKMCVCRDCQLTAHLRIIQYRKDRYDSNPIRNTIGESMSTINLCDRCDTMMTNTARGSLYLSTSATDDGERLDLCPGCVADAIQFIADGKNIARNGAFRKPYVRELTSGTQDADEA